MLAVEAVAFGGFALSPPCPAPASGPENGFDFWLGVFCLRAMYVLARLVALFVTDLTVGPGLGGIAPILGATLPRPDRPANPPSADALACFCVGMSGTFFTAGLLGGLVAGVAAGPVRPAAVPDRLASEHLLLSVELP